MNALPETPQAPRQFFGLPMESYEASSMAFAWFSERYQRYCTTRWAHVSFPAPSSAKHVKEDRQKVVRSLLAICASMLPVMAEDRAWCRKFLCKELLSRARRVRRELGIRPARLLKGGAL